MLEFPFYFSCTLILFFIFCTGFGLWSACLICLFQPAQRDRAKRILALIPNTDADSHGDDSSSDDEPVLSNVDNSPLSSKSSSPAPSINSSLERLNLLDETDIIYDRPISPILREVFPEPSHCDYDAIPSISSLPSLPSVPEPDRSIPSLPPPETPTNSGSFPPNLQQNSTHTPVNSRASKRKATAPLPKQKKQCRTEKLQLNFKWKATRLQHRADIPVPEFTEKLPLEWTPLDYFYYFFPTSLIDDIVSNTNLYSVQETGRSIKVTMEEMSDFLGIDCRQPWINSL